MSLKILQRKFIVGMIIENKPVYMIILFNDEDRKHHELVRIRSDCDEKYHDSDGSLYHIYYVFFKKRLIILLKEKRKKKNMIKFYGRHEFKRRSLSI